MEALVVRCPIFVFPFFDDEKWDASKLRLLNASAICPVCNESKARCSQLLGSECINHGLKCCASGGRENDELHG